MVLTVLQTPQLVFGTSFRSWMMLTSVKIHSWQRREGKNGNEFNICKALYQEGIDKLLKTTFASPDDALDSLRAVLSRSFRELSIKTMVSKS